MKLVVVVLLAVTVCVLHAHPALEWWQWKTVHGRRYQDTVEEAARRDIWMTNYDFVQKHNTKNGGIKLELNQFADMVSKKDMNSHCSW